VGAVQHGNVYDTRYERQNNYVIIIIVELKLLSFEADDESLFPPKVPVKK